MEPNYTAWWLDATDEAEDWRARAEKAEERLAALRSERDYWKARCQRAEGEAINADMEQYEVQP